MLELGSSMWKDRMTVHFVYRTVTYFSRNYVRSARAKENSLGRSVLHVQQLLLRKPSTCDEHAQISATIGDRFSHHSIAVDFRFKQNKYVINGHVLMDLEPLGISFIKHKKPKEINANE